MSENPNFSKGIKFDENKPKYKDIFTLLDLDFIKECSEVMKNGQNKYGFENWKKDLETDRIENALLRHIITYLQGNKLDKESNKSHLSHAMCNLMFLYWNDHK